MTIEDDRPHAADPAARKSAPRAASKEETATNADFLARIYADPADDALRQVYGDWLAARGDPRGELIAVQYARRAGTLDAKGVAREASLLRKHGTEWLGRLAPFVQRRSVVFERGFLARCALNVKRVGSEKGFRPVVGDPAWATVEHLSCDDELRPVDPSPVFEHPVMRSLREVHWRRGGTKMEDGRLAGVSLWKPARVPDPTLPELVLVLYGSNGERLYALTRRTKGWVFPRTYQEHSYG